MTPYHRPRSLAEAIALRPGTMPLAGGTDVYPARATRAAWGDPTHPPVLDLSAIPGLSTIEATDTGWRIGPLVTWSAIRDAALPPLFDGLRAAARDVGGRQVQNRGTIVGNLCTASPAGDGIPNLLALDAAVETTGPGGVRHLPVAQFVTGYGPRPSLRTRSSRRFTSPASRAAAAASRSSAPAATS
ncbi:FAD binding domain-containing protein [Roseomonas sp. CCTCC AB2023176]|uniref:FAD binding domain-containing protein n=1 Tax=Roseomonas sp. CCTCC AB2023176 TaxID=3342640 RepID=UPI0035DAC4BA